MNTAQSETASLYRDSRIKIPYTWAAGETASRFLIELRDNKKIFGLKCPSCKKVFCPPKKTCGDCFVDCIDWVEVGPQGKLTGFTQAIYEGAAHPVKRPIFGLILLEGASTAILHLIKATGIEELKIGDQVKPVFKEERQGHILDILHFEVSNHG